MILVGTMIKWDDKSLSSSSIHHPHQTSPSRRSKGTLKFGVAPSAHLRRRLVRHHVPQQLALRVGVRPDDVLQRPAVLNLPALPGPGLDGKAWWGVGPHQTFLCTWGSHPPWGGGRAGLGWGLGFNEYFSASCRRVEPLLPPLKCRCAHCAPLPLR